AFTTRGSRSESPATWTMAKRVVGPRQGRQRALIRSPRQVSAAAGAEPPSSAERHGALALVAIVVACREFLQRHGPQPSLKGHNRAVGHAKSKHCVGFLSQTVASALKCWRLVVE